MKTESKIAAKNAKIRLLKGLLSLSTMLFVLSFGSAIYFYLEFEKLRTARLYSETKNATYPKFLEENSSKSCEPPNISEQQLPDCPETIGFSILPNWFPIHSVYIGFQEKNEYTGFFQSILRHISSQEHPYPLVVLVPREQMDQAENEIGPLVTSKMRPFVKTLYTPSKYTVWAQDYFEWLTSPNSNEANILDLPYDSKIGEHIPSSVALACDVNLLSQAPIDPHKLQRPSGNFGGNIEAVNQDIVMVGNSMSKVQIDHLTKLLSQTLVTLDVGFLKIGHVDELFSVLHVEEKGGNCPFDILYSSPKLALDLIGKSAKTQKEKLMMRFGFGKGAQKFNLWECTGRDSKNEACQVLYNSNIAYEKIVNTNIQKLTSALKKSGGNCQNINFVAIPTLFIPENKQRNYGTRDDGAIPLDPNPINNFVLNKSLFLPKQNLEIFQNYTVDKLKNYSYELNFLDGEYVHQFMGGLHCSINIRRTCKSKQ